MERLTKHWGNNYVPVKLDYTELFDMSDEQVEALQAIVKKLAEYEDIGTVEEVQQAMEKQTAISRVIIEGQYFCPKCKNLMKYPGYCGCGQKVY